jgi:hypothetical protein
MTTHARIANPRVHGRHVEHKLAKLAIALEAEIQRVKDARLEALLETTREIVKGLLKAYRDYDKGKGKAWGGRGVRARRIVKAIRRRPRALSRGQRARMVLRRRRS